MNLIVVKSSSELKSALHKNADEIIIEDEKLIQQLRVVGYLRKAGPIAIGIVIAAIPLIPFTGGASLPGTSKNHRFHPVPGGVCSQFSSLPIF